MPLFKKRGSEAPTELETSEIIPQQETPPDQIEQIIFDVPTQEESAGTSSYPEYVEMPIEGAFPEEMPQEEELDPEKESIFYFGLPKDPPKTPEPIKVDGVPTYERRVHRRYKKRNRHPLSAAAKTVLTLLCIIVFFALLMLIVWLVFPS